MRAALLSAGILLALAAGTGLLAERARERAGVEPLPGRVPLGGFEPLAVDLFYLRASSLLEEQRLPEALAAIRVVTELQPRVAEGWAILGTLVAWRNSESAGSAADEWRYVREGLGLVERGTVLNPDSPSLWAARARLWMFRVCDDEAVRAEAEREAERDGGALPEREACDAWRRYRELADSPHARAGLAEAARRLGYRLLSRGDHPAAAAALSEALPLFREIAADPSAEPARRRVSEIETTLRDLPR